MPLPPKPFHLLTDVAARWSVLPIDIVAWATEGLLALSVALPSVRTASSRTLSDFVEVAGSDLLPLFRSNGARVESVLICRIRVQGEAEWQWIAEPPEGITITAAEVVVKRSEMERFEHKHELWSRPPPRETRQPDGPECFRSASSGAPPRYDWNAFAGAVARRVHDEGMPASQGELIRDMLDWFGANFGMVPDERTVRRRVQALWPVLTKRA